MVKFDKMTTVYRNLKTGAYSVQPYTIGPVAATEFGDPTIIQPIEFEDKMADAVLENLEKFGKEQYDRARAILRGDKQQREFLKNHVGVGISEQKTGGLIIHALHREGGGMVSSHEDTFILSKDEIPEKLTAILAEAFRRAT
jgi:hypothetical protein